MLPVGGRQDRGCIIPQAVTHSLVLLKKGKIISRNMLSWLELLISRYCCIYLVVYITYINDARSSKYQIMKYIFFIKYIKNVLWRVAKRLSYIDDARCLKVKTLSFLITYSEEVCTVSDVFINFSLTHYRLYSVILLWVKVMPGKIKYPARRMGNTACGTSYFSISLISFTFDFI